MMINKFFVITQLMTRRIETNNKIIIIIDKRKTSYVDTETITSDIEYKHKYYKPIYEYLSEKLNKYCTYNMVEEIAIFLSQKYELSAEIIYHSLCSTVRGHYSPSSCLAAEHICQSLADNTQPLFLHFTHGKMPTKSKFTSVSH